MSKPIQFSAITARSLSLARITKLYDCIHRRIEVENLTLLHISPALMTEWRRLIDMLIELILQARAEETTKRLVEADRDCNHTLSYLLSTINNAANSPTKAHRDASDKLRRVVEPYRQTARQAYDVKMSQLKGLLLDVLKPEFSAAVTALALPEALMQLEEQVKLVDALMQLRGANRNAAKQLKNARTVRPLANNCYRQATEKIYASQLLCTEPADLTKIQELITTINRYIADARTAQAAGTHATDLSVYGTSKAVVIINLPQGETYRVADISARTVGEGISAGARIDISVPVGIYTVWCNGAKWEKEITVK